VTASAISLPPLLQDILNEVLELLADGALSLDPVARARMRRLQGRTILVRVQGTGQQFTLRFTAEGLRVDGTPPPAPTVTLTADPLTLGGALLLGTRRARTHIDGDETVLQEFREILRNLRPDPAHPLEQLLGPEPARAVADAWDIGVAAFQTVADLVLDTGDRFLRQQGRRWFVDRERYEQFVSDAYSLRLDMDRLEARIALLEAERRAPE
jgi:ubiquinone biosynthesis protein UbiJ